MRSGLALTTHYFSLALVLPEAAWLLWQRRGARIDVALATSTIAAVGLALLPVAASQRGNVEWVSSLDFGDRLLRMPEHFLVGLNVPWGVVPFIVGAAVTASLVYAVTLADAPTW